MKIAILGNSRSSHIISLTNSLLDKGHEVFVISGTKHLGGYNKNVNFIKLKFSPPFCYIFSSFELKSVLKKLSPDILNTHYATGYGTLSALCNFEPTLLSVWGSDIFEFPWKSILHYFILKFNLSRANFLASTSKIMALQLKKIYNKRQIFITPFGIDTSKFLHVDKVKNSKTIVIGTVKSLHYNYGIDILILAFSKLCQELKGSEFSLRLEITGDGPQYKDLIAMCSQYGVLDKVTFHGNVKHSEVPKYLNRLDIYVALSRNESFGVAILEACASGLPVLVSNAPGPSEVVIHNKTGIIVDINNINNVVNSLKKITLSSELRFYLGKNARQHVLDNFDNKFTINKMLVAYQNTFNFIKDKNISC
jgi:glycosyltransferase involved in cell wall biosynthesis